MKKRILLLLMFFGILSTGFSQTVSILNKTFVVNGNASCPIYFNGANTPWNNWNDFGGNYNSAFWSTHFATLKANGINASRVWISCNGDVQPNINTDGTVTGVSAQFWANLDDFFASAKENGIYIMATMMSFDHTKNTYNKYQSWRNMLNDQAKVKTYCDNYLVPFVNRYKTNPYLMSIDISNEIEWVAEDASNMKCSYAVLQRFVAMCASSIHNNPRTDGSTVLVTLGSAATKWNGTKMRKGSNGPWSQNNSDGNKWSDAALKAQYNQANAVLDYYSPHYYSWIDEWYSNPFERTPTDFGIDEKPVLIGETPAGNPGKPNMTVLASYEALKKNGYQGHFPWTSNGVDALGDISKFGTDAKTFATTYSALIKPTCSIACATVAPTVKSPVVYCKNDISTELRATGTDLKWYVDNTTSTALSAAPIPLTSKVGTMNYYVSQTLNKCEGPRALITVTIKDLPTAMITTTTPTTFCSGENVLLSATTGNGLSYVWNKEGTPISNATSSTYSAASAGLYTVRITANGCSFTSQSTVVTVLNRTAWYQDLDGDGKGDAGVSVLSCVQPIGYVSQSGDNCPTDATKITPGICGCGIPEGTCISTAVVDLLTTEAIKIMPNPSSEQFNLILIQPSSVSISSIDGKLIEIFSTVTELKFGSNYAKGVYVIQIMNGSTTQVVRVIKQ